MRFSDGIRVALASLIENPLRTFLTLLGISIGVTAVIFVVSVIRGLDGYINDKIGNLGHNVFVLNRWGIIKSREEWIAAEKRNKDIRMDDVGAIRRGAREIRRVGITVGSGANLKYGRNRLHDVNLRGVSVEILEIEPYDVWLGRPFNVAEIEHAQPVTFIGYDVAEMLFGQLDPINRKISMMGRKFRVIGVGEKKGTVFGQSRDNYAMIPLSTFFKIRGSHRSLNLSIQVRDPDSMDAAIDEVRSIMRARHHVSWKEDDTFGIITSDGIMQVWSDMTSMIFRVAIFVVSISLVVGGIVIMNIMLLAVVERTREIGIRKAIGARQRDIMFQFLVESIVLCTAGGILGVMLGWLGTWLVRTYSPLPAAFPIWAPLLAVVVTSAVGIFFGLYPARQAADLDPIDALRVTAT